MSYRSMLIDRCDIETSTQTADAYGSQTETWADLYRRIQCRVCPLSGQESEIYERRGLKATHKIFIECKSEITEDERVVLDSRTFNILRVINPSEMNHHLELIVEEIL